MSTRFRRTRRRPERSNGIGSHIENQREHAGRSKTVRERSRSPGLFYAVNQPRGGRQLAKSGTNAGTKNICTNYGKNKMVPILVPKKNGTKNSVS
jgi:hypothetical protein